MSSKRSSNLFGDIIEAVKPHSAASGHSATALPHDFSTGGFDSSEKSYEDFHTIIDSVPIPTAEQLAIMKTRSDSNNFGALQMNSQKTDWARGYVIEVDGRICSSSGQYKNDLVPLKLNMDRNLAAKTAGLQGLAAGKLYISSHLLIPSEGATIDDTYVSSGFCYEKRFFITTRHFHLSGLSALEEMVRMENADKTAKISLDRCSPEATGELEVKCAYLLYENLELDIAIFALSPTESSWPTYVEYSQLLATDKFDYLSTFANQNVFSVGYATPIDYRYIEYWKNFKLLYQNEPLVKDNIDPPNFEKIFHPCERILAVGKLDATIPEEVQSLWKHYIPGWFGMSGGLIGILNESDGKTTVSILGMFKGGIKDEKPNEMVPFTRTLIDLIRKTCHGQETT